MRFFGLAAVTKVCAGNGHRAAVRINFKPGHYAPAVFR